MYALYVSSTTVNADDLPLLKKYRDEIDTLRKEKVCVSV
jgi:hypothetical protein